ncbi:MAG: tetratricopeptide repeat protein [Flavobacteriales bacterium]
MTLRTNSSFIVAARCLLFALGSLIVQGASAQIPERAELDTLDARHDKSRPLRDRFRILANHVWAEWNAGAMEQVRVHSLELIDLAQDAKSDSLLWRANLWVGGNLGPAGDVGGQLEYAFKARAHAQAAGDAEGLGATNKEIGICYKLLKDYPQAISALQRAASYTPPRVEENRICCHLSEAYRLMGLPDSALFWAQRSNTITDPVEDSYGYARSQLVLGRAYAALGDHAQAELFYKRCIQVCDSFHVVLPLAQGLVAKAESSLSRGQPTDAIHDAKAGLTVALEAGMLPEAIAAVDVIQRAYWATGNGDSAYIHVTRMVSLQDSLTSASDLAKIKNVAFKQDLKEREDAKLQEEAARTRSKNIQFGIIALIVITLGIFLLIFSRTAVVGAKAIKNLSLIALLLFFEFINLLLHPFLDRITNHSPILMLLAMAAIAGLLIPLHHRMEKLITNMLVSKNNRVRLEAARRTIEELESKPEKS